MAQTIRVINHPDPMFPRIVCLCGSTRFAPLFRETNLRETIAGRIVLSIGCDMRSDEALGLAPDTKVALDVLHKRKIDLADEILVINATAGAGDLAVTDYVGESTRSEINYARDRGRPVRWLYDHTDSRCRTLQRTTGQHGIHAAVCECAEGEGGVL